jgi:Protein of unknown function (DUF5663)
MNDVSMDDTVNLIVAEVQKYPRLMTVPENQLEALMTHVHEEVELRVGTTISDTLSDDQFDEFERLMDHMTAHPELAHVVPNPATAWLAMNYPGYEELVRAEISEVVSVLAENIDRIVNR